MHRLRLRKPSPATVVALVALFVSFAGTAYAAFGPFNGDKIINEHSLSGNRLKRHTLSGTQINVSRLGKVPNASNADHATTAITASTANTANTVGGKKIRQFNFIGGANSGEKGVLTVDGLVVKAGCDSSHKPLATIENDSAVPAQISLLVDSGGTFQDLQQDLSASPANLEGSNQYGSGTVDIGFSNRQVVTINYQFDYNLFGALNNCTVNGSVIAS